MRRRSHIVFNTLGVFIWTLNSYFNWSLYGQTGPSSTGSIRLFSMVVAPILALVSLAQLWKLLTAPRQERILDPHVTLTIEESLVVRVVRMLLLAAMAAAGAWGLMNGVSPLGTLNTTPLLNILFLGIGGLGLVAAAFNPRQRLTLTPQGLNYSQSRPAAIAWEEVVEVRSKVILTTMRITLILKDSREFRPASLLARWRSMSQFSLIPLMFGVDPEVLKKGVEIRRYVFTF